VADNRHLNIILDLKNNASKELEGFQGKLQGLKPTFQKMALVGTAAFAALSVGIGKTVQGAAEAEGTWNKFNTVFGEGADEMKDFINEIRKTMPTATHEIARLAADMQDLLVPMGLARDQAAGMSKGFLDVANKIAAFNDVDPSEVLEAIKSGLSGSSEPLKRFGVNALETALETRALKDGLLGVGGSFKDLAPEIRAQVRAQALLAQVIDNSSDAINGFEANNDSFIRRQQDMKATMKEINVVIGNVFLPIIDSVIKKLKPVVDKFSVWAKENPKLIKTIVVVTAAVVSITAILGFLGLAILALTPVLGAFATLVGLITLPMLLIVGAIGLVIAAIILMTRHWETIQAFFVGLWESIWGFVSNLWTKISDFFTEVFGGIGNFFVETFEKIKNTFVTVFDFMLGLWVFFLDTFFPQWNEWLIGLKLIFENTWNGIKEFFSLWWDGFIENLTQKLTIVKNIISAISEVIKSVFTVVWEAIKAIVLTIVDAIKNKVVESMETIKGYIEPIIDLVQRLINKLSEVGASVGSGFGKIKDKIGGFFSDMVDKGGDARGGGGDGGAVDDGVITPDGKIISTNPKDFLIATKKPGDLAGGSGMTIIINGGIFGSDAPEELANQIIEKLNLVAQT